MCKKKNQELTDVNFSAVVSGLSLPHQARRRVHLEPREDDCVSDCVSYCVSYLEWRPGLDGVRPMRSPYIIAGEVVGEKQAAFPPLEDEEQGEREIQILIQETTVLIGRPFNNHLV